MIIFRTDASPQIGFGHLTRCRALAQALIRQGQRCVMVGPDTAHAKLGDQDISEDWIPVSSWTTSNDDAVRVINLAHQCQAQWLVLDDYRIDEAYQLNLHAAGLRWLQFDGGANKSLWADIVLNANPAARAEDYAAVLSNQNTLLLLGPRYAILRPEFERIKPREPGRPVKQILVTFGGGDDRGGNEFVLSTLLPATALDLRFLVISGASNPNNSNLRHWVAAHGQGRVCLHIDPEQVAPLFASCDLAVMAGGASIYEAACCGLPMLVITIADNQIPQSKAWVNLGVAKWLGTHPGVDKDALIDGYNFLNNNRQNFVAMSIEGSRWVDAGGADKTAKHMLDMIQKVQVHPPKILDHYVAH